MGSMAIRVFFKKSGNPVSGVQTDGDVKNEQSVIGNQLKQHFERLRP
jgi:hypothetical protein